MVDMATEFPRHPADMGRSSAESALHLLADDLLVIAMRLKDAAEGGGSDTLAEQQARTRKPNVGALALARKTYAMRRKRAVIFGKPDLFGEPAWDILLDLFIAAGEGKAVSVSSACIGSAAPATTGLRWLGVLADEGLVLRENDPEDHRRVLVRLAPAGQAAMERYFEAVEAAP